MNGVDRYVKLGMRKKWRRWNQSCNPLGRVSGLREEQQSSPARTFLWYVPCDIKTSYCITCLKFLSFPNTFGAQDVNIYSVGNTQIACWTMKLGSMNQLRYLIFYKVFLLVLTIKLTTHPHLRRGKLN